MRTVKIELLYPEFNNLYGDRGNLLYLKKKLAASSCKLEIISTPLHEPPAFSQNNDIDILYIGPCTEHQQELELERLSPFKEAFLQRMDSEQLTLATGNAFELFGEYIERENGEKIPALGIFPYHAKRFERLRYNDLCVGDFEDFQITGFKNQLSHSYGTVDSPFLQMEKGCGLNPNSALEGVHIHQFFATYLIGPLLPLNPDFTDYLLRHLLGKDYHPVSLPFEDFAYACRIADLTKPAPKKQKHPVGI